MRGVVSCHEGRPGRGADRGDIRLLQDEPPARKPLEVGREHVGVVPGDVVVT